MNQRRRKHAAPAQELPPGPVDWWLLAILLLILCIGLLAVLSASGPISLRRYGESYHYFYRQLQVMLLGGGIIAFLCWVPRSLINKLHYWGIGIAVFLLLLCPLLGPEVNGAQRWIDIKGIRIQPMEFTRVALVLYLAYFMSTKQDLVKEFWRGVFPALLVTGLICGLLMLQPDFGGTFIMLVLLAFFFLAGGSRVTHLLLLFFICLCLGVIFIVAEPYRWARLIAYLEPFANAQGSGYQIVQSLYALGSGGLFGAGLGGSMQKIKSLPEAHNDFIMSVIGEETGFLGFTVVMVLFALFFYRCYLVVLGQKNLRDRYSAYGLTLVIAISFLFNIGVVLGSVPPKGVAMPFISYGGSSLLSNMICAGLLLNYSRTARE